MSWAQDERSADAFPVAEAGYSDPAPGCIVPGRTAQVGWILGFDRWRREDYEGARG